MQKTEVVVVPGQSVRHDGKDYRGSGRFLAFAEDARAWLALGCVRLAADVDREEVERPADVAEAELVIQDQVQAGLDKALPVLGLVAAEGFSKVDTAAGAAKAAPSSPSDQTAANPPAAAKDSQPTAPKGSGKTKAK